MVIVGLVVSLAIGLSLGLLGGGGSILTVPVIHYLFGVEAHGAIAMSLVVVGATSAVALIPHARAGRVRWRIGVGFGLASMVGAFAGGHLGARIPAGVLIAAFAALMIAAGLAMLVRARRKAFAVGDPQLGRMLAIGLGVGLVTGVLGAGGGFLIVPALTIVAGLAIDEAIGTSLFIIMLNSISGFAGAQGAEIDVPIVAAVTLVAIAGCLVGARLVGALRPLRLQQAFGYFVIAIAVLIAVRELV